MPKETSGNLYLCIKQFNARLGDELNLKVGDKIEVLSDDSEYNDGWYMGKNIGTDQVGLYPKSFTQILADEVNSQPTLLRSRSRRLNSGTGLSIGGPPSNLSSPIVGGSRNNSNNSSPNTTPSKVNQLAGTFESLSTNSLSDNKPKNLNGELKSLSKRAPSSPDVNNSASSSSNPYRSQRQTNNPYAKQTNNAYRQRQHQDKRYSTIDYDAYTRDDNDVSDGDNDLHDNDLNDKSVAEVDGSEIDNDNDDNEADESVNKTMDDIDRALQELQTDSMISKPKNGHQRNPSGQSLVDDLNPTEAKSWTPKQVTSYFSLVLGFDLNVAGKFARHKITGEILFELDLAHLKELDIDSFGTRFEINKEIEKLRKIVNDPNAYNDSKINNQVNNATNHDQNNYAPNKSSENKLAPSVSLSNNDHTNSRGTKSNYKNHQRKKSQSMENLSNIPPPNNQDSTPAHLDKSFKFGGVPQSNGNGDLGLPNGLSRPASSVYDQSMASHSRNISTNSNANDYHHRRNSSAISANHHRRHSSMFLFASGNKGDNIKSNRDQDKLISPAKIKKQPSTQVQEPASPSDLVDIDHTDFSPRKLKSISYRNDEFNDKPGPKEDKRSISDSNATTPKSGNISRFKTLKTASTQNIKNLTSLKKLKTSAFQEGIRQITPDEAIKSASFSGFMSKRSGNNLSWRSRYFTLHGTRLLYFTSLKDKREKGLIDITAHKVIPVNGDGEDKYVALYAASTGLGKYCFKLLPPAPGFKKGLTFTQPKTHYFAVDTYEEMRGWMKSLMTATIDIDDSIPVVSSCSTPTVSLNRAQELLAKAREETKIKDNAMKEKGYLGEFEHFGDDNDFLEAQLTLFIGNYTLDPNSSGEASPLVESIDESLAPSSQPKLSVDTARSSRDHPSTPQANQVPQFPNGNNNNNNNGNNGNNSNNNNNPAGFASPYLLASGLLSPRLNNGNLSPSLPSEDIIEEVSTTSSGMDAPSHHTNTNNSQSLSNANSKISTPIETGKEYFPDVDSYNTESTPKSVFSNSNGRILSGGSTNNTQISTKKKRQSEKMMAYSSDGSGNHTFYIKHKR